MCVKQEEKEGYKSGCGRRKAEMGMGEEERGDMCESLRKGGGESWILYVGERYEERKRGREVFDGGRKWSRINSGGVRMWVRYKKWTEERK